MAGSKIEHSLADKARQLDELQARADKFQQFIKTAHRDMVNSGQQIMQFFQQFNQTVTGGVQVPGAAGPIGMQTEAGKNFATLVNQNIQSARASTPAEAILVSERIRARNARAAGYGGALPPSAIYSQDEIANANREAIVGSLSNAVDIQERRNATAEELRGWSRDPERRRRRALIQETIGREARQADLKSRLLSKYGSPETADPLAGAAFLSTADRARADQIAAVGGPTHFRYDISDVPGMQKISSQFQADRSGIMGRVESLMRGGGPNADINKSIAIALENVVKRMDISQAKFAEASQNFARISADPKVSTESQEYKVALNQLRHSIENLTNSNQDLARINRAARDAGGEGGGGGAGAGRMGPIRAFAQKWGPLASAVAGAGAAAYGAYLQTGIALDSAALGKERMGQAARGESGAMLSTIGMQMADMTDPMNLFKYRADRLFGRQYRYAGLAPSSLRGTAMEELTDELNINRQKYEKTKFDALTDIGKGAAIFGGGLLTTIATGFTGAGVIAGGAMMAYGLSSMLGSTESGISDAANNKYLQLKQGGLEGSIIGRMYRGDTEAARRAGIIQEAATAQNFLQYQKSMEALRESEIREFHSNDLIAAREIQSLIDTRQMGIKLAGTKVAGISSQQVLDMLYGKATPQRGISAQHAAIGASLNPEAAVPEADLQKIKRRLAAYGKAKPGLVDIIDQTARNTGAPLPIGTDNVFEKIKFIEQIRSGHDEATSAKFARENPMYETAVQSLNKAAALEKEYADITSGKRKFTGSFSFEEFKNIITKQESGGRYDIWNAQGSGAYGRYQMIAQTRKAMAKRLGISPDQFILRGPQDKEWNDKAIGYQDAAFSMMTGDYINNINAMRKDEALQKAGYINNFSDLELAKGLHFRGYTGIRQILLTGQDRYAGIQGNSHAFAYMSGKGGGLAASTAVNSPTSLAAQLEMSPSQFASRWYAHSGVLGSGRVAAMDDTARLMHFERSGLGSFESLIGNMASLNRTVGGQDNQKNLEAILASAVKAGFDNSRTAQMFTRSIDETARSMNMTNVSMLAGYMGNVAAAISPTGKPDERSLALAASGIKNYSDYTAQKGGIMGALKMASIVSAGGTMRTGLSILQGMGAVEAAGALDELSEYEKTGIVNDPRLKDLLTLNKGNAKQVRKLLQATRSGSSDLIEGQFIQLMGGLSIKGAAAKVTDLLKKGDISAADALIQTSIAQAGSAGEFTGLGAQGGKAHILDIFGEAIPLDVRQRSAILNEQIEESKKKTSDPAKVQRQKYIDSLIQGFRNKTTGITAQEAAAVGGIRIGGDSEFAGMEITNELIQKSEKNSLLKREIQKTTSQVSALDIARAEDLNKEQISGVDAQMVKLARESVVDLGSAIAAAMFASRQAPKPPPKTNKNENEVE